MDRVDALTTRRIAGFCCPGDLASLANADKHGRRNTHTGIALSYHLCRTVTGIKHQGRGSASQATSLEACCWVPGTPAATLLTLLRLARGSNVLGRSACEPKDADDLVASLWQEMADTLGHGRRRCAGAVGPYRRPRRGVCPARLTLQQARLPKTWSQPASRLAESRLPGHEVYRLDRLRVRSWMEYTPTAMALIY
jgi:hypothetical protein